MHFPLRWSTLPVYTLKSLAIRILLPAQTSQPYQDDPQFITTFEKYSVASLGRLIVDWMEGLSESGTLSVTITRPEVRTGPLSPGTHYVALSYIWVTESRRQGRGDRVIELYTIETDGSYFSVERYFPRCWCRKGRPRVLSDISTFVLSQY